MPLSGESKKMCGLLLGCGANLSWHWVGIVVLRLTGLSEIFSDKRGLEQALKKGEAGCICASPVLWALVWDKIDDSVENIFV